MPWTLTSRCFSCSGALNSKIASVEQQIQDIEASIREAKFEATKAKDVGDDFERSIWERQEQQLRAEKQQLRTEEQQLREGKARNEALHHGTGSC